MQIIIHDLANERFLKPFKLDPNQVRAAIDRGDGRQEAALHGAGLNLIWFSKKFEAAAGAYFILVCCAARGRAMQLVEAYKMPYSLIDENEEEEMMSPLDLFKKLVRTYGLKMRIGTKTTRFLMSERVPVDPESNHAHDVEVLNPECHDYIGASIYKRVNGESETYLDCSLCYALDTTVYLKALDDMDV